MKKFNPSKLLITLFYAMLVVLVGILWSENQKSKKESTEIYTQTTPNQYQNQTQEQTREEPKEETLPESTPIDTEKATLPSKAYLDVPFLVQAPNANWDARHEEACEEASLAMVNHYIKGTKILDPDAELDKILTFQEQNGYKVDVTISQLNQMAGDFYGLKSGRVIKNATKETIQKEIAGGKPVIIPAAGKLLPNPNFRNGGPNYHMLVVKGYDEKGFITNDPGTRLGNNFHYDYNDLINAIHDWNESNIQNGEKNVLVFD